jgi:hypothetical protein
MKVKKVIKNDSKWFDLKTPLEVQTAKGNRMSRRFYFNGFREVFQLIFSDESSFCFTSNHRLKNSEGCWVEVGNMKKGLTFINDLHLVDIKNIGIMPTMDMEVEDVHEYILGNGIHSHNSSFILGQVSPSIEPLNSNYFVKNLAKGKFTYKNPYLEELLEEKGKNNKEVWTDILNHGGSVQHLDFLSQREKDIFKTFGEISQKEIIIQAAQRQKYIDQGQSLNLMIPADVKAKDVNQLVIFAWEQGIKTLYYQRSTNPSQTLARNLMNCSSCEA